jgi:arylsulfatase A-like enzyme
MTPQVLADAGGKTIPERSYVVSEINQLGGNYKGRMVASADFKYILFDNGANREVLFDLVNDPGELHPVTYDPAYREQLLAHRNMLLEWDATIGDEDFSPEGKFPELP